MTVISIDALYDGFVDSLPAGRRPLARSLPFALKLAPATTTRWSDVFSHEVTLGAPALIAEAFPAADPDLVRTATLAHALAVIEAFGSDRVADGQVHGSPELLQLLELLRASRNQALASLTLVGEGEMRSIDERTAASIAEERGLLARVEPVTFPEYERVSLGKQAIGFPGSRELARALGADSRKLEDIDRALEGVWLGLQFEDDVIDWEDDWPVGGAWAVCLAANFGARASGHDERTAPDAVRRAVHHSGALRLMLERSCRCYRSAWRHALALGAFRLASWAKSRENRLDKLIPLEAKHAGYSVRARRLSPWAVEVLA